MASPYRERPATPPPVLPVLRGKDEARSPVILWLLLLIPALPLSGRIGAPPAHAAAALIIAMVALHSLDRRTRRYHLRIGPQGFRLKRYRFGIFLTDVFRASLEWEPHHHDEWDDFERAGFTLAPPPRLYRSQAGLVRRAPVFGAGKDTSETRAVLVQLRDATAHFRRLVAATDTRRESRRGSGDLAALWGFVDASSVERGPWGRARRLKLTKGASLGRLRLPPKSVVDFEGAEEFQDPRTPDRVTRVTLGGPTSWEGLPATLAKGAVLSLDERRRIQKMERAFQAPARIQGVLTDGLGAITFDERSRLRSCHLGGSLVWGALRLPAGTRVAKVSDYCLRFEGPGILIEGEDTSRLIAVQVSILPAARRSPLGALLREPAGRVQPLAQLCEQPGPGNTQRPSGHSHRASHTGVPLRSR